MQPAEARRRFEAARVARLATVGPAGSPHIVPITFAVDGDTIYSAVDHKPKRTLALKRLENIAANPRVSLLVDEYDEDWSRLWWARADGDARVLDPGAEPAMELLARRYPQYEAHRPAGPVIEVTVERWSGWTASD